MTRFSTNAGPPRAAGMGGCRGGRWSASPLSSQGDRVQPHTLRIVMPHGPQDTRLPLTAAAVVGQWLNNTPWEFATWPGTSVRHETRMTFAADGTAIFRSEAV